MSEKTVVAVKVHGQVDMFEFPNLDNALDFVMEVKEKYTYVDYLIGKHDKESASIEEMEKLKENFERESKLNKFMEFKK